MNIKNDISTAKDVALLAFSLFSGSIKSKMSAFSSKRGLIIKELCFDSMNNKLVAWGLAVGIPKRASVNLRIPGKGVSVSTDAAAPRPISAGMYGMTSNDLCGWSFEFPASRSLLHKEAVLTLECGDETLQRIRTQVKARRLPVGISEFDGRTYSPARQNIVIAMHILPEQNNQDNRTHTNRLIDYLLSLERFNIFLLIQAPGKDVLPILPPLINKIHKLFIADGECCQVAENILLFLHDRYFLHAVLAQGDQMHSCMERLPEPTIKILCAHDERHQCKESGHDEDHTVIRLPTDYTYSELYNILLCPRQYEDKEETQGYVEALMELTPWHTLTDRLAVVFTRNMLFSRYVVEYMHNNDLPLAGLYSLTSRLIACSYCGIPVRDIAELHSRDVDICLIPTLNKRELLFLDKIICERGIGTHNFIVKLHRELRGRDICSDRANKKSFSNT